MDGQKRGVVRAYGRWDKVGGEERKYVADPKGLVIEIGCSLLHKGSRREIGCYLERQRDFGREGVLFEMFKLGNRVNPTR